MVDGSLLSVVIPAHREGADLLRAIPALRAALTPFPGEVEVIISLDGADEATSKAAFETGAVVIGGRTSHGKGHAVRAGLAEANGDLLAYIDADMELAPAALVHLVDQVIAGADAAVASKWHERSLVTYPFARRVQSRIYRSIVRALFGLRLSDTQAGLKVFRSSSIRPLLPHLEVNGFAFDIEILVALRDAGRVLVDGPVEVRQTAGTSTTRATAGFGVLLDTLRVWRRRRAGSPPFSPDHQPR